MDLASRRMFATVGDFVEPFLERTRSSFLAPPANPVVRGISDFYGHGGLRHLPRRRRGVSVGEQLL